MQKKFLQAALLGLFLAGSMTATAAQGGHFLADRHVERGTQCAQCHTAGAPAPGAKVDMSACTGCHGPLEKVAERTKKKGVTPDPHYNHLVGLSCLECHQGHKHSKNVCSTCHFVQFKVP